MEDRFRALGAPPALIAALVVLGFLAYGTSFDGEFVWDDASSVLLHQHVKDPSKFFQLFAEDQHAFAGGQGNFYRPLVSATFMLDYAVANIGRPWPDPASIPDNLSTVPFHLTNVLWHVAAAILFALFIGRTGAPRAVQIVAPVVFVLHPLHTEAVAYISGRADMMAAAFVFAGLYATTWTETYSRFLWGSVIGAGCYALALMSKEAALIYPALLALYLLLLAPRRGQLPHQTGPLKFVPLFASVLILALYTLLRSTVLSFGSDSTPPDTGFATRLVETFQSLALYLKLLFVPTGLHMERTLDGVPTYVAAIGLAAFLMMLAAIVWARARGHNRIVFAFAWFIVTWIPISGIFPLNAPMAEHWMYLPMAGFFWALAELFWRYAGSGMSLRRTLVRRGGVAAIAIGCLALLVLTADRNEDWNDNRSLFTTTLRENPDSVRVHFNLAVTYQDLLDNPAGARRHFAAVADHYRERKLLNPELKGQFWDDELEANLALGDYYREHHRHAEALVHYGNVLQAQPTAANQLTIALAALGSGRSLVLSGDYTRGMGMLQQAVALEPGLAGEVELTLTNHVPLAQFRTAQSPLVTEPQ